jgi:threonylcarbamoyladenosine tRNA methylthiotransferase MtaB
MNQERKVAFHTLGCKLNFAETSTIARQLKAHGFDKVNFNEFADVYIINTCSVTDNADKECKTHVHRALHTNPDAVIIIIGCYAQLKPKEIAAIPGVSLVLGATEKFNVIHYLETIHEKQQAQVFACAIAEANFFTSSFSSHDRTRVFLKVQDGCDYTCAFCTIPLARGKSRSNTIENVLQQTEKIKAAGAKEIVLTGVNLGDFGKVNPDQKYSHTFYDLVKALDQQQGTIRYRISSIEPNLLTDEIIEWVSTSKKFMPHFHIPLQSGSDKILKVMRRRYLTNAYSARIEKIKKCIPHACIGVDVITGFPGETEEDFLNTYAYLNQLPVSYLHVFTYSERENTAAMAMHDCVPYAERKKRTNMLRILSEKKLRCFYEQHAGTTMQVLFESDNKNGFMHGYSENYVKIKTPYRKDLVNRIETCIAGSPDQSNEMSCEILSLETA